MENYKTPKETLKHFEDDNNYHFHKSDRDWIVSVMEMYGKQQYNKAVLDCVENAHIRIVDINGHYVPDGTIDKDSMLKLIKE